MVKKDEKTRLQIEFESKKIEALDTMKERIGAVTRAEVVRNAMKVADYFTNLDPESIVEITNKQGEIVFKGPAKLLQN